MQYEFKDLTPSQKALVVYAVTMADKNGREGPAEDLTILVDGYEIDFLAFFDRVMENLDYASSVRARDIVREKFDDIMSTLNEVEAQVNSLIEGDPREV